MLLIASGTLYLISQQGQMLKKMLERQCEDSQRQREDADKMTAILQQVLDRLPPLRSRGSSTVHDSPPEARGDGSASLASSVTHSSSVRDVAV